MQSTAEALAESNSVRGGQYYECDLKVLDLLRACNSSKRKSAIGAFQRLDSSSQVSVAMYYYFQNNTTILQDLFHQREEVSILLPSVRHTMTHGQPGRKMLLLRY